MADVTRLMRRSFDARTRHLGITRPQWRVMAALSRFEGCTQTDLADLVEAEPITVGRIVDRLEHAGLAERRADPGDRRVWRLFLTPQAQPLIAQLQAIADTLYRDAIAHTDPAQLAALEQLLIEMRDNLMTLPPEAKRA